MQGTKRVIFSKTSGVWTRDLTCHCNHTFQTEFSPSLQVWLKCWLTCVEKNQGNPFSRKIREVGPYTDTLLILIVP